MLGIYYCYQLWCENSKRNRFVISKDFDDLVTLIVIKKFQENSSLVRGIENCVLKFDTFGTSRVYSRRDKEDKVILKLYAQKCMMRLEKW